MHVEFSKILSFERARSMRVSVVTFFPLIITMFRKFLLALLTIRKVGKKYSFGRLIESYIDLRLQIFVECDLFLLISQR